MGSSSNNSFFCNLKFSHKISSFRSKKLLDDEPSYAKTHDKLSRFFKSILSLSKDNMIY